MTANGHRVLSLALLFLAAPLFAPRLEMVPPFSRGTYHQAAPRFSSLRVKQLAKSCVVLGVT